MATVARVLAEATAPLSPDDHTAGFTGKGPWKKRFSEILAALVALGRAREVESGRFMG